MRQGQQNRRGRGRNNNNRKGHNPLTRSFESNGPDVKIRGTPAHIAEKYMSLARDAQASADPVLAENYLQHAEHYNRIIMTFREQHMQQTGEVLNGAPGRTREEGGDLGEFDGEDDGEEMMSDSMGQPIRGHEPQPRFEGQSRQGDGRQGDRPQRHSDHNNRDNRDHNNRDHNRPGRDRFGGGRPNFRNNRPEQGERGDRGERSPAPVEAAAVGGDAQPPASAGEGQQAAPRRRERFQPPQATPGHDQPEFLRRSVRRPRRESVDDVVEGGAEPNGADHDDKTTN